MTFSWSRVILLAFAIGIILDATGKFVGQITGDLIFCGTTRYCVDESWLKWNGQIEVEEEPERGSRAAFLEG